MTEEPRTDVSLLAANQVPVIDRKQMQNDDPCENCPHQRQCAETVFNPVTGEITP